MLIGLIILVVLVIAVVVMYNGFIRLKNQCDEAFATMDVYLKKRYDLIPNLVETVKGYAAHEKETLQGVIEARNMAAGAATLEEKAAGEKALAGNLRGLFAIAENYPDLKANTNFLDLQNQLKVIEDDIANSRKYYNAVIKEFNTKCEVFPSNLIASIFHFEKKAMFEVDDAVERQNVKVSFQ
ncbi:MAG: LemA family protein [Firmicutes bacterium]|nr:LemA family protein [Bacillota bacterium]